MPSSAATEVICADSIPQGVIHCHGALIRHLDNLNEIRRYAPDEVLFSNSPFFWIGGLAYSLLGTLVAATVLSVIWPGNAHGGEGRA